MRRLPQSLRRILAVTLFLAIGAPISPGAEVEPAMAAPAPIPASRSDDQGTCHYLRDVVDGEGVAAPIFVDAERGSVIDGVDACSERVFDDTTAFLAVRASGGPDFAQDGAYVTSIDVLPGTEVRLRFVVTNLPGIRPYLNAPARWTLSSEDVAAIVPETGEISVSDEAPHGRELIAHGEVQLGGRVHSRDIVIRIYTREANPLAGDAWTEVSRIRCDDGEDFAPEHMLKFLVFHASGRFSVVLADGDEFDTGFQGMYGGAYIVDPAVGTVTLVPSGQGDAPPDFDGSGSFTIEADGTLVLVGIWLAGSEPPDGENVCGLRFERTR